MLSMTDDVLKQKHQKFLEQDFNFDLLRKELDAESKMFGDACAYPRFFKRGRAAKGRNYFEATIEVKSALLKWGGKPTTSYEGHTIHRRIIDGNLKDMAKEAFELILAAKRIAEIVTALEETCVAHSDG